MSIERQVADAIPHLKQDSSYLFDHVRKGPFVAVFKGTTPAKAGDPQDEIFIEVEIRTEDGSGQERLANTFIRDELGRKVRPKYEGRLIRPSLLKTITTPSSSEQKKLTDHWLGIKEELEQKAASAGADPVLPLSLPTKEAFKGMNEDEELPKRGFFKRLFGGKD